MNFAKYISVIAISMIKFAGGPLTGLALRLGWVETAICSVIGMMITVSLIVFLGEFIQKNPLCLTRLCVKQIKQL